MTKAIVTKTGNSYALRVPKHYIDDNHLKLGDTVEIEGPLVRQQKALRALRIQAKKRGRVKAIDDPVVWQRNQRVASDPRNEAHNYSAG